MKKGRELQEVTKVVGIHVLPTRSPFGGGTPDGRADFTVEGDSEDCED